jgi:hypothetical protein
MNYAHMESSMTIYIAGPDGKPMAFATDAEAEAYRQTQREARPPMLKALCRHSTEVHHLHRLAYDAMNRPRGKGRGATLAELERRLQSLNHAMHEDIQAAELEMKQKP